MKKILFIFALICISCNANVRNHEKVLETKENDSIIGTWNLLKSVGTKTTYKNGISTKTTREIKCNVCPIIILKKNGNAILSNPPANDLLFNWVISGDIVSFSFKQKSDERLFFSIDKEFQLKMYRDSNNYFLELVVVKDDYKYVLIRSL